MIDKQLAVKLYQEGKTARQVAQILNCGRETVRRALIEANQDRRPRGTFERHPFVPTTTPEKLEQLKALYATRATIGFMASATGVPPGNVEQILRNAGVPKRPNPAIGTKRPHTKHRRGPDCPNYIDGSFAERRRTLSKWNRSKEYKTLRAGCFGRDNHTCQQCGLQTHEKGVLCAHHIEPWAGNDPASRKKLENLVTLCQKCHNWVHSKANTEKKFLRGVARFHREAT